MKFKPRGGKVMFVELDCNQTYSEVDGNRLVSGKKYVAEIIYDMIIIKGEFNGEKRILISVIDYLENEWFLKHLSFSNVVPISNQKKIS
jgi:hypothetical protein